MNFKIVALEVFAILVSTLLFNLPLVLATDINIYFGGVKRETTTYETENIIYRDIDFIHEPNDILWKNVKVALRVNSASLEKEIKKIYLYKCKKLSPMNCIQSEPQVFENFVDVELLWSDISEREGVYAYPQVANLLIMVKLEDLSGSLGWIGLWYHIRRTGYNAFTEYSHDLGEIDVHANSLDMVNPIKMYIENYGMIPFNWLTKAVFRNANSLYALGADSNEIESSPPSFLTASPPTNEINTINKDFYFIFPNTSSGVVNPLTLNLNPTFTCGDGNCESDLGETPGSCCIDCACPSGQYCDVDPTDPTVGECKSLSQISLQVVSTSSPQITDCSATFDVNMTLKINNPPSSLSSDISSVFSLNETVYPTTCYGGPPEYYCLVTLNSQIECGQGSYNIEPNEVTTTITYKDGPNDITTTLDTSFSPITVNYNCLCEDGFYCDIGEQICKSEDAITLGITSLTDYLDNYTEGDTIDLKAKIFNPPTGLTLISSSAVLNLTGGTVAPGSPTCTEPSPDYEYNCSIPFQISGYSPQNAYTFDPNTLKFTITYKDGTIDKTKVLETNFGPVSIPSQFCGDGSCNMGETQSSCCIDCDCPQPDDYCDPVKGCEQIAGVTVSIEAVNPTELRDCEVPHLVNITLRVNNAPSTLTLDHYYHVKGNLPTGWSLQCDDSDYGGIYYCRLTIPAIDGCALPYYTIGNNKLNVSISFDDGGPDSTFYSRITKQMTVPFSDIRIIPVYHCGDGECESSFGEGSNNCCIDCACPSEQYCDVTPSNENGTCKSKNAIKLVIDSPKSTVRFSTCELPNKVYINAYIQNPPSDMQAEQFYGTLNGSPATMHCDTVKTYGVTNHSFNCTMTIPSVYKCEQEHTYRYKDNSFSVYISYKNGDDTETKALTEELPNIETTQSIRSMYNIMEDARQEMERLLNESTELLNKTMEEYRKCMKRLNFIIKWVVPILFVASLVYGGGRLGGAFGEGKWNVQEFGMFMSSAVDVISTIIRLYAAYCKLLTLENQLLLVMKKMEMDMLRIDVCMEMVQHELDIGNCRGREESCFNTLVNCMNFANINNWMAGLQSIMSQVDQTIQAMRTDFMQSYNQMYQHFYGYPPTYYGQGQGYVSWTAWIKCGTGTNLYGTSKCGSKCGTVQADYKIERGCSDVRVLLGGADVGKTAKNIDSLILSHCPNLTPNQTDCPVTYQFTCMQGSTPKGSQTLTVTLVKGSDINCEATTQ
ncbi:MAG: hypothetical protein JSW41_02790 [Candidatus Aenigmatarchaeota archaeon]|nr:MAG: hypothetical protein JSW41_02790 [Candidatus Aenigmarchaeota archaeon]